MAKVIKRRLPIWEQILIRPDELWSPCFKDPRVQEGARRAIQAAKDWAKWN